jgi:hypothetical protein
MCKQHLVGEHKEMHQAAGTLLNHPHGEAVLEGQAKKGYLDVSLLEVRHDALAREMEEREYDHDSPWDYDLGQWEDMGEVNAQKNAEELADRCEDCRQRMLDNQ